VLAWHYWSEILETFSFQASTTRNSSSTGLKDLSTITSTTGRTARNPTWAISKLGHAILLLASTLSSPGLAKNSDVLAKLEVFAYEDFQKEPRAQLERLLDFLGIRASATLIQEALEYGTFANMRRLELAQDLKWNALPGSASDQGLKTRRGAVGGYLEEFSPEDLRYLEDCLLTVDCPLFSRYLHSAGHPSGEGKRADD
jgi:hypothetical protein